MADATASPTMGVSFSNLFMSNPVAPGAAATQIAALPVMHAKTFSYQNADLQFIQAAASKNLRLAVGIPNDQLQALANGQTQGLINTIGPYAKSIELLCVGNEPLGAWYHGAYLNLLVPAMQQVQKALQQANLRIGVTVPLNYSIMANSYPPSAGQLDSKLTMIINNACGVMAATGAPFMINVYPFLDYRNNRAQIPLPYCLFTATQSQWFKTDPTPTRISSMRRSTPCTSPWARSVAAISRSSSASAGGRRRAILPRPSTMRRPSIRT